MKITVLVKLNLCLISQNIGFFDKIEKRCLFLQKDILAIIWLLFEKIMRLGGHLVGNLENI